MTSQRDMLREALAKAKWVLNRRKSDARGTRCLTMLEVTDGLDALEVLVDALAPDPSATPTKDESPHRCCWKNDLVVCPYRTEPRPEQSLLIDALNNPAYREESTRIAREVAAKSAATPTGAVETGGPVSCSVCGGINGDHRGDCYANETTKLMDEVDAQPENSAKPQEFDARAWLYKEYPEWVVDFPDLEEYHVELVQRAFAARSASRDATAAVKGEDAWLDEIEEAWLETTQAKRRNVYRTILRAFAANLKQQTAPEQAGRAAGGEQALTKDRARDLARSYLYGAMGYLGIGELKDEAVESVAVRLFDDFKATPAPLGLSEEVSITIRGAKQIACVMDALKKAGFEVAKAHPPAGTQVSGAGGAN